VTALATIGLAIVIGWLVMRILRPAEGVAPRWAALVFEAALGVGAGIGITSVIFIGLRSAGLVSRAACLSVELGVAAALAGVLWRLRSRAREILHPPAAGAYRWTWLLAIAAVLALLLVVAIQVNAAGTNPYGNWDAFALWNLHAKFLLAPGSSGAGVAVPSLLSSFIGRTWLLNVGDGSPAIPLAIAALLAASTLALLFCLVVLIRGMGSALLALLVFLSATAYIEQISWQYADILIGFYLLAALASGLVGRRGARMFILAAAFAVCAIWTWAPLLMNAGAAGAAVKGSAGVLATEFMLWGRGLSHPLVLLAIVAVVVRLDVRPEQRVVLWLGSAAVALMLIVDAGVYLASAGELPWLVGTRVKGMYAQVWPSAVLLVFLVLGKLEDPPMAGETKAKKGSAVRKGKKS